MRSLAGLTPAVAARASEETVATPGVSEVDQHPVVEGQPADGGLRDPAPAYADSASGVGAIGHGGLLRLRNMPGPGRGSRCLHGCRAGPALGNGLAVRVGACEGAHKVARASVSRYETTRRAAARAGAQPYWFCPWVLGSSMRTRYQMPPMPTGSEHDPVPPAGAVGVVQPAHRHSDRRQQERRA